MRYLAAAVIASAIFVAAADAAGPNVVVIVFPKGMVQTTGGAPASDSFTIANTGDANAALAFQGNATFFALSPTGAVLPPGGTQTVSIRGTTQSSQAILASSVTITGSGVPQNGISIAVRLMVAPKPAANNFIIEPDFPGGSAALQSALAGFIVPGPNQQISSAASFRNRGDAAMQGMAVGSTSWLVPQTSFVNIGAGQDGQATFIIDPSKRPDASAPLGGVIGTLSLRFLNGGATDTSVSINVVSVVQPGVAPGEPPPLNPGELALFIPGLSYRNRIFGDLFLSARRGDPAVTDLKMYYARSIAGSSSLASQIAQPAGSLALWFPSIVASVFGKVGGEAGSIQIRGGLTTNVSVAAVQIADPGDGRVFYSALPVLRSDRAIGNAASLMLTGVERSNTRSTTLYLQEMSGSSAMLQSDFFDAAGAAVGTRRVDTVNAFRSIELLDIVPAGATSIRVTNLGGGRIGATAIVSDNATFASWPVVDTTRNSPTGTNAWVIPVVMAPQGSAQVDVFVSNETANSVPVTLEKFTPAPIGRRRAVHVTALGTSTLRPLETQRTSISPMNGLLGLTAPAGVVTAAGRMTMTNPARVGSFGASLPVVPLTNALASSQGTRFTGVDDMHLGPQSSLILAEVGGGAASVRVTLRYMFVAGLAVSSQAISKMDFTVTAGQMLIVPALAGKVIGPLRDALGDLRNMQVDVDVVGGSGRVLPFIESVDANSGNVVVRAE
jgi:hypothetical protein